MCRAFYKKSLDAYRGEWPALGVENCNPQGDYVFKEFLDFVNSFFARVV